MQRFGTTFLRCTTDADFEPVTLEEAKLYCRIDTGSEEDSLLSCLITAARQHAERKTGRVLRASTWTWRVEGEFPLGAVLPVPLAPCSACLSVSVDGEPLEASMYAFTPSGNGGNEAPLLASLTPLHGFPARGSVDCGVGRRFHPAGPETMDAGTHRDAVRTTGKLYRGREFQRIRTRLCGQSA